MSRNDYDNDRLHIEIAGVSGDREPLNEGNRLLFRTSEPQDAWSYYLTPNARRISQRIDNMGLSDAPPKVANEVQNWIEPSFSVDENMDIGASIDPVPYAAPYAAVQKKSIVSSNDQFMETLDEIQKKWAILKEKNAQPFVMKPQETVNEYQYAVLSTDPADKSREGGFLQLSNPIGDVMAGVGKTTENTLKQAGDDMYSEGGGDIPTVWDALKEGVKILGGTLQQTQTQAEPHHPSLEPTNPVIPKAAETWMSAPIHQQQAEAQQQTNTDYPMGKAYIAQLPKSPELRALEAEGEAMEALIKTQFGKDGKYLHDKFAQGNVDSLRSIVGFFNYLGNSAPDTAMIENKIHHLNGTQPGDSRIILSAASDALTKISNNLQKGMPEDLTKRTFWTTDRDKSLATSPLGIAGAIMANITDIFILGKLLHSMGKGAMTFAYDTAIEAGLTVDVAKELAKTAGKHMRTFGMAGFDGIKGAGTNYSDTLHKFVNTEIETLRKDPQYEVLIKSGKTPEEAQVDIAIQHASKNGMINGLIAATLSYISGQFVNATRTGDEGWFLKLGQDQVAGNVSQEIGKKTNK